MSKGEKPIKKIPFIEKVRFLIDAGKKFLNSFKNNVFLIENSTPDPTPNPTPHPPAFCKKKQERETNETNKRKKTRALSRVPKIEISPFKLNENFVNEIRNDKENINSEMFTE